MKVKDIKAGSKISLPNVGEIEVVSVFYQYGLQSVTLYYKRTDGKQFNCIFTANKEI